MDQMELQIGDVLKAKISKIELIGVKCPKCGFEFEDAANQDPYDCPSCGEEFINVKKINVGDTNETNNS
jgi:predicted Zn-ribbon and HTH transcriptional regulator